MKKTQLALQRKPRRLNLNRETIRVLNNPALLELAKGGALMTDPDTTLTITLTLPTQESTSQRTGTQC